MRACNKGTCRKCGAAVLAGLDDDHAGLPVVVDVAELGEPLALNEVVAILSGRGTFDRMAGGGRTATWELWRRDVVLGHVRRFRHPVHLEHRC